MCLRAMFLAIKWEKVILASKCRMLDIAYQIQKQEQVFTDKYQVHTEQILYCW